jgi:hypothetical protein
MIILAGGSTAPAGDAKRNATSPRQFNIGPSRTGVKGLLDPPSFATIRDRRYKRLLAWI